MPVSTSIHISSCLQQIINIGPASVLDVGCGFGMWGFLCRMYLDVFDGRLQPRDWQVRIVGLELFEPYIQDHQRALYDEIRIADIRDVAGGLEPFDLIIAGDVIEHLDKEEGEYVVDQLYARAGKALIVNIPLGEGWEHGEQYGNPGELHRSQWSVEDFLQYPGVHQTFELPCGAYGSFVFLKNCPTAHRVKALTAAAEARLERTELHAAADFLRQAHVLEPANQKIVMLLADTLLKDGQRGAAVEVIEDLVTQDPGFIPGHMLLARVLSLAGRRDEAIARFKGITSRDGVDAAVRRDAEKWLGKLGA